MKIPETLIVKEVGYSTDGGTISLKTREPVSFWPNALVRRFLDLVMGPRIILVQHMIRDASRDDHRIPGRLYFYNELIPIRSERETSIIAALRRGLIAPGALKESDSDALDYGISLEKSLHGDGLSEQAFARVRDYLGSLPDNVMYYYPVKSLISYVESSEYLEFAAELASNELIPIRSEIKSTLYLASPGGNRIAVMKILRKEFQLSLGEAKSIIEQTRPELTRGSKLQIDKLHDELVAIGATVEQIDEYR